MYKTKPKRLRYYLKWVLWLFVIQFILANTSAAIYAYKFTHFYSGKPSIPTSQNIFNKTWKLFTGPSFYKMEEEPLPPFAVQNITLKTTDDILIDAWYSTVDSAKGTVIFFHGITVNKSFLNAEAEMFRSWGYNVLLVDFRAHGKSSGNTSTFGVKETDEVEKAFEFVKAKGEKKIILYGVSLGAGVCLKAVAENSIKPTAIIADMPFGTLHNHLKKRAKDVGFPSEPFGTLVTAWMGIERGYNGFNHNVASYAKNVDCPVLMEWGEKDRFVSSTETDKVYESLSSKNKKLIVYPNADHESFLGNDPVKWENEMKAFLNSLTH
jgi:alpha-beta hydrolase superfamily lysophospholipase